MNFLDINESISSIGRIGFLFCLFFLILYAISSIELPSIIKSILLFFWLTIYPFVWMIMKISEAKIIPNTLLKIFDLIGFIALIISASCIIYFSHSSLRKWIRTISGFNEYIFYCIVGMAIILYVVKESGQFSCRGFRCLNV